MGIQGFKKLNSRYKVQLKMDKRIDTICLMVADLISYQVQGSLCSTHVLRICSHVNTGSKRAHPRGAPNKRFYPKQIVRSIRD